MSDSVKKYYEMQEEGWWTQNPDKRKVYDDALYIWVLDFEDGKVYKYVTWNPDEESVGDYLYRAGHSLTNCEWMVNKERKYINGN
jgi:hypothetical protein